VHTVTLPSAAFAVVQHTREHRAWLAVPMPAAVPSAPAVKLRVIVMSTPMAIYQRKTCKERGLCVPSKPDYHALQQVQLCL
jgi:hypothetical protein